MEIQEDRSAKSAMSDASNPPSNVQEYDPDDAIHEAVLAEKEKRSLKLVQTTSKIGHTVLKPGLTEARAPSDSGAGSQHDELKNLNMTARPRLTHETVLLWAEMHFERRGEWPRQSSGPVVDCPGEWWNIVDADLIKGARGLPGGTSLAELISKSQTLLHNSACPELSEEQIFSWADTWCERTGTWPDKRITELAAAVTTMTWSMINAALLSGSHGLPGGASLRGLLQERR